MQEFESSSISYYTHLVVNLFVSSDRFEDVLSEDVFLINIVKVIVIDCSCGKYVLNVLIVYVGVVNIFEDELTKFGYENIDIFHNKIELIKIHLINDIFLRERIPPQHEANTTQQYPISKLNIIKDIFLQQLGNKLAQPTILKFNLNLLYLLRTVLPILALPLIQRLNALHLSGVILLYDPGDKLQEEFLFVLGQGLGVGAVHLDDNGYVGED